MTGIFNETQFICFRLSKRETDTKYQKLPIDPRTGAKVSIHNKDAYTTFEKAKKAADNFGQGHGVAFVITQGDPYFFVDLDNHYDTSIQDWSPLAKEIRNTFPQAYVETINIVTGKQIGRAHV